MNIKNPIETRTSHNKKITQNSLLDDDSMSFLFVVGRVEHTVPTIYPHV